MSQTTTAAGSIKADVSPEEWQRRVEHAAAFRLCALYGWDELLFAHISTKVPGEPDHILMHPASMLFEEVTASLLHKLDRDGQLVIPSEHPAHSFAFPPHRAVLDAMPDAQCVIHLHSMAGMAIAMQKQELVLGNQYAMFLGPIGYHDYDGLLSEDEAPKLIKNFGEGRIVIQKSHGFILWGRSVKEAFMTAFVLNRACEIQLRALAGGAEPYIPPQAIIDKTANEGQIITGDDSPFVQLNWDALLRKLDRDAPDYKT